MSDFLEPTDQGINTKVERKAGMQQEQKVEKDNQLSVPPLENAKSQTVAQARDENKNSVSDSKEE